MTISRRARIAFGVIVALMLPAALLVQVVVRPPDSTFDKAPDGWTTSANTDDLAGLLTLLHTTSIPMQLATTDYARIAAYASEAYWRSAYRMQQPEQARSAFLEVAAAMLKAPGVIEELPEWDRERTGAAAEVLGIAAADGYDKGFPDLPHLTSPLDLGVEPERYSWRVSAGFGNELERTWGDLVPLSGVRCDVPAPPVRTFQELQNASRETSATLVAFMQHPNIGRVRGLIDAWRNPQQANPSRAWILVGTNVVVDAGLERRDADRLLRDLTVALHDTQISAWAAKYDYALASPAGVLDEFRPLSAPYNPSYPSEFSSLAAAATQVFDRYAPGVRVRLEIPGSEISVPTTRVYRNSTDAQGEAEIVGMLLGLDYRFSVEAGRVLGGCVAGEVLR